MRVCQANIRVSSLLEQIRMTMLVPAFPTLDDAVLAAWPAVS